MSELMGMYDGVDHDDNSKDACYLGPIGILLLWMAGCNVRSDDPLMAGGSIGLKNESCCAKLRFIRSVAQCDSSTVGNSLG